MSYEVTVTVVCDAPDCRETVTFRRINSGGLTKTRAGLLASATKGWWVKGSSGAHDPRGALCPGHRPAARVQVGA